VLKNFLFKKLELKTMYKIQLVGNREFVSRKIVQICFKFGLQMDFEFLEIITNSSLF